MTSNIFQGIIQSRSQIDLEMHYEQAAAYPKETYMSIYIFIGLNPSSKIDSLITIMTTGTQMKHAHFNIFKSNLTATAYKWQIAIQHISSECKNVLRLLNISTSV